MRRIGWLLAILGVALAAGAPFLLGGSAVFGQLRDVRPQMFVILAGMAVVSTIAKAGKLQILLASLDQHLSFSRTLVITFATDFAFLASPAGAAGYVVNAALLKTAGASWTAATTVVGAEQALDLVFFAVLIPVVLIFSAVPLARMLPAVSPHIYVALIGGAAVLALGLWCGRHFLRRVARDLVLTVPWFQKRRDRIGGFVLELRGQMTALLGASKSQNIALLVLTTIQWLARYGVLWVVLLALDHAMPFGLVMTLQAVILHVAMWTGIPSGGGSADLALAAALAPWVPARIMAVVLLLWRFATLYFPLVIGALSLAALTFYTWRVRTTKRSEIATQIDSLP